MRKGRDVENGGGWKIVATNVVASRPPKCQPTGMPNACAKNDSRNRVDTIPMSMYRVVNLSSFNN